jgi:hypothetical protein
MQSAAGGETLGDPERSVCEPKTTTLRALSKDSTYFGGSPRPNMVLGALRRPLTR